MVYFTFHLGAVLSVAQDNSTVSRDAWIEWVKENAIHFSSLDWQYTDLDSLRHLDYALEGKRIVYLGEPDHYIHEKYDFRLLFIRYLFHKGWRLIGMEMGLSDCRRIDRYLETGDTCHLDRVAIYGYRGDQNVEGEDEWQNKKTFHENFKRFIGEERRFLKNLRSLNESLNHDQHRLRWFGYDVDIVPGGGYTDAKCLLEKHKKTLIVKEILNRMTRVKDESLIDEIKRLQDLLEYMSKKETVLNEQLGKDDAMNLRRIIICLKESIVFKKAMDRRHSFPLRLATARRREKYMYRQIDEILDALPPQEKIILLGHNIHLGKNSEHVNNTWLGLAPKGYTKEWISVGTYLARKMPGKIYSIWMLYDYGWNSIIGPNMGNFPPQKVSSDPKRIEHYLSKIGSIFLLPFNSGDPRESFLLQKNFFVMKGGLESGIIKHQADAIFFVSEVSALKE